MSFNLRHWLAGESLSASTENYESSEVAELKRFIDRNKDIATRPASISDITAAEKKLNITFTPEYVAFLRTFGVISGGATETIGLGTHPSSHLYLITVYKELYRESNYPENAVPLIDQGDGHHFYLYCNDTSRILHFKRPRGGVVKTLSGTLSSFLIETLKQGM